MELALFALVLCVASLAIGIVALSNSGRARAQVNLLTQELDALRRILLRSGALAPPPSPTLPVAPVFVPRPPVTPTVDGGLAATTTMPPPIAVPVVPPPELPPLAFVPSASTPDG